MKFDLAHSDYVVSLTSVVTLTVDLWSVTLHVKCKMSVTGLKPETGSIRAFSRQVSTVNFKVVIMST